ncbi:MAG TPA: hypothetical protein VHU83_22545 [Bryobacteraceae bacterium]|jgi:hypothetical protein|nr:hypothetical protein [Bryobacteraceae bacterium]
MKILLAAALLLSTSAILPADPVSVTMFGPNDMDIFLFNLYGSISCAASGVTSAACSFNYGSKYGNLYEGSGTASASAAFGSASASVNGGEDRPISGVAFSYLTSFANDIVVTGGTGAGTLIVQYQINAGSLQTVDPMTNPNYPLPSPTFTFVQGSVKDTLQTNLTAANSYINEPFDVTSSFQFGTPFAFGGETQATGEGNPVGTQSSLKLTGFEVLDASGHVIADAQLIPGQALGTGIFTPEPVSASLMLLGLVALWPAARKRRNR